MTLATKASPDAPAQGLGDISRTLAAFIADSETKDIPPEVFHQAKRTLVSFFSTCIAGSRDITTRRMLEVLRPFFGPPGASLIGRPETVDLTSAAFLNAVSANALDFDDTHSATSIHLGSPIFASVLGVAEQKGTSGKDLLHAFVLGADVACRLGRALSPSHYARGWHITATCGVIGAAAAVSKLLGLDEVRLTWALGIAATSAGGLVGNLGTTSKGVGVGSAARDGLLAAKFAQAGVDAAQHSIEGAHGFLKVMSDSIDATAALSELGHRWELLSNTYKPYPTCAQVTSVVDAALDLRAQDGFNASSVRSVIVEGSPALLQLADRPAPRSGTESVLSIQHASAIVLLRGRAGLAEFSDAAIADPEVLALRACVSPRIEPALPSGSVRLLAELTNGRQFSSEVSHPRGGLERPLGDDELTQKGVMLLKHVDPRLPANDILEQVWNVDRASEVRSLIASAIC